MNLNKIIVMFFVLLMVVGCGSERTTTPEEGCTKNTDCDPGFNCNVGTGECEEIWVCTDAQSCYAHDATWNAETNPAECKRGVCVAKGCETSDDCDAGKICSGGACIVPADCSSISSVKIVTPEIVLTQGTSKQLVGVALNRNGVQVVIDDSLMTWATSSDSIVAVNSTGFITGGSQSGTADITATYCAKTSNPLPVLNFATMANGKLRVIVRDIEGGAINNATIKINSDVTQTTTADGFIEVDNSLATNTISVFHSNYQYVSVLDTAEKDIIFYLDKYTNPEKSGGFKGNFDFSSMTGGEVKLAIAGASLPGNIMDLDFDMLLGELIMTHVKVATIDDDYPLPSGIVAVLGEDTVISDTYEVTGKEGNRIAWGWGGKLPLANVVSIVSDALGGGTENIDLGGILTEIMPFVENFSHSLETNQTITHCPKIVDTTDINGNGSTTDLVSDFNSNCFPVNNMALNQPLSKEAVIKFPTLPKVEGVFTDLSMIIVASNVEGSGLVPMGIGAGTDKKDNTETADGKIDDTSIFYAPQYNGIEGSENMVVLLTLPVSNASVGSTESLPVKLSGVIKYFKNGVITDNIDMSQTPYMPFGEDVQYNKTTKAVSASSVSGASLYRVQVTSSVNERDWIVYSATPNFTIPTLPENFGENFMTFIFQAVKLEVEGSNLNVDSLFKFNNTNLDNLVHYIAAFSAYELPMTK